MTRLADRWVPITVLGVASLPLVASVAWVASVGPWTTTAER